MDEIEEARRRQRQREVEERPQRRHPRDGYTIGLFLGRRSDGHSILVEIHETYNVWADENSRSYHYRPYDLTTGNGLEIKTIGFIGPWDDTSPTPPRFVVGQFPEYEWIKLRGNTRF